MMKRNQPQPGRASSGNPPTHTAKLRHGSGDTATYERIGAGWMKEDGSLYVRLLGVQVVSEGFTLYPVDDAE